MLGYLLAPKCYRYIYGFLKHHVQTSRRRHFSESYVLDEQIRSFISENTEVVVGSSLTPEIKLRLLTPNCRFWREKPELWPFTDPYWAIYWPGGQALSRYILDNPNVCQGRAVLDLGSGCGASCIAAKLCSAAYVVANDIDPVAAVITKMNCELNNVDPPVCVTDNIIGSDASGFDLILLGDMFYDEALADSLHRWLDRCIEDSGAKVLIGDPGRAYFEGHGIRKLLHHLAQFELPESVREENYGLISSHVWCYNRKL